MKKKIVRLLVILLPVLGISIGIHLYLKSLKNYEYGVSRELAFDQIFNPVDLKRFTDLRGFKLAASKNLEKCDLSQKYDVLLTCTFDTLTPWPPRNMMPAHFNPGELITIGQDPGLGVRALHSQAITGKGVKVAIIDFLLFKDHEEYKERIAQCRLATGESILPGMKPSTHGTAVASILAGSRCGTAPGASLYFWAVPEATFGYKYEIAALNQIMEYNKGKEITDKIRIVSISKGLNKKLERFKEMKNILKKANKSGPLVFMSSSFIPIGGVRGPLDEDRNIPANYKIAYYLEGAQNIFPSDVIYAPCENRTLASNFGEKEYSFYGQGGVSWAVPYLAGIAALAYQVNSNLTPSEIIQYLKDTGTPFNRGWMVNPDAFIQKVANTLTH